MRTTVIHHSADFDGLFCREIARNFLPEATLIGWDYGDPVPTPDVVSSEDKLYMLDISIEGLMGHPNLIWIDHHKSAIEKFGPLEGYQIDGVAACRLAWVWFETLALQGDVSGVLRPDILPTKQEFIDRTVSEPIAVRLAGEYDIWDKRDERAEMFQFGLRSRELTNHDWSEMLSRRKATIEEIEGLIAVGHDKNILNPDGTHTPAVVWQMLDAGKMLQAYQQRNDAGIMHRSFMVELEGLKFLTLNTTRFNSLTFVSKDVPETGHDALMGFNTDGKKWTVSLYHAKHRTDLDLSSIAKKFGGGGHRGACGFVADKLPFLP